MSKVGIYVPHGEIPDQRGFSPAIVAWNHALRMKRFQPTVLCSAETQRAGRESVADVPVVRLPEGAIYRRIFKKWTRLDPFPLHVRAARLVRGERLAVFHAHQLEVPVTELRRSLRNDCAIVVHAHVTAQRFFKARGTPERYLAVSEYVRDVLVTEKGYPAHLIDVLPNGVDTAAFRPAAPEEREAARRALGLPEDTPLILFAGRKQEVKGFDVFLAVAERILARGDVHFLAVGPEPADAPREQSYPARQAARGRLMRTGRYRELDAMPQSALPGLFQAADILFVPSRIETQGMVMIEGMAAGLIVVSSARGGIRESLRHGETGLLLQDPTDTEAATAVIESVLNSPSVWQPMRLAARQAAETRFGWDAIVSRLEGIYGEVLGDRRE